MIAPAAVRRLGFALLAVSAVAAVRPRPAGACSGGGNDWISVGSVAGVEPGGEPPGAIGELRVASVRRGVGPESSGCGEQTSSSCDDGGTITLELEPSTDPDSPPGEVGYALEVEGGRAPREIEQRLRQMREVSAAAFLPLERDGAFLLVLGWTDGAQDEQEPFDFELRVTPVDLQGNLGPSSTVRVRHPGRD